MKNFVSCHVHQQSLDSASTPEAFAERELELGTGYIVTTDHGTLQACRKLYDLAQGKYDTSKHQFKGKLRPILGLEGYVRDDDCPILKAGGIEKTFDLDKDKKPIGQAHFREYAKYFHVTMHFLDQEAFETACRILPRATARAERHGQELKPLFTWADLEELGAKNVTMTSSCLIGMVQRHLLEHNNIDMAVAYYERLRSLCRPGNFYVEVFPHTCDRDWDSACYMTWADGTVDKVPHYKQYRFLPSKTLKLDGDKAKAEDLARKLNGRLLNPDEAMTAVAIMNNKKWEDMPPKQLIRVHVQEGFIINECRPWSPWQNDPDIQRACNHVLICLAEKYGDKILIGDDSHFAKPEEKIVQDVRLQASGGKWRFSTSYHRQDSAEAYDYFRSKNDISLKEFEGWVENTYEWASKFHDFKFKDRKSLPVKFYPDDTFAHTMTLIEKHGRMDWTNPAMVDRLQAEIKLLHENGTIDLLPYFFLDEECVALYSQAGELTGPGRGSAAGLLLTYLLGITHVDPLRFKLSMERFLTLSRIKSGKLPDIDQDLGSRDLLCGREEEWLEIQIEDGSLKTVPTNSTVRTSEGIVGVHEAAQRGLEILEWL